MAAKAEGYTYTFVTPTQALNIQRAAWFTPIGNGRWGVTVCWIGNPGQAKTAMLTQLSQRCGLGMTTFPVSIHEPTDFAGLPVPLQDGNNGAWRTVFSVPSHAKTANDDRRGHVMYFDETNTAAPAVQAAMMRVLQERHMGDEPLGPLVRFVMSMNHADQAAGAGGSSLATALANRVAHIGWSDMDATTWCDYVTGADAGTMAREVIHDHAYSYESDVKYGNATDLYRKVADRWPVEYSRSRGLFTAYLTANQSALSVIPNVSSDAASSGYPTPRSWENALRAYASAQIFKLSDAETIAFIAGFVGLPSAEQFFTWAIEQDLPDPVPILEGKVAFEHDRTRLDRTMAFLSTVEAILVATTPDKKDKYVRRYMDILSSLSGDIRDIVVTMARRAVSKKIITNAHIARNSTFVADVLADSAELVAFQKSL